MDDPRNLIVRLALEAQALLDLLKAGRHDEAHELADEMAELAAAIAEALSPRVADNGP